MKNSKEKGKICYEKVKNIAQIVARKSVIIVARWLGIILQPWLNQPWLQNAATYSMMMHSFC